MKYIKTYEYLNEESKYKVDDYIILRNRGLKDPCGQILETRDDKYTDSYLVEFLTIDRKFIMDLWFQENHILRNANQEEIDDFESKKEAIKYNL